ncbi:hypothetical protein DY000_02031170 [Brassica cretica]|uniref:Syntaxin N-terminal domain-containing protein n=1 Tax=Brassica cretica TaxID=69181 RepID=A0ABQ7DE54_BRACR|nr:hypothetical protein DY000_02031170 [Brassica cretica]
MKSQPDSYTRAEIDQLVEEIYRTMESAEERLDRRCDDMYFLMDLTMSSFTSQIEAIQREIVEIQRYIARRPEASTSIDRHNNKSTDSHRRTSIDEATNRRRLVPKFNLESFGDRLQKIENTTATMKDKWRRGDEAMRDFTGRWFNKRREEMEIVSQQVPAFHITSQITFKVKLNDYNKALSGR